MKKRNVIEVELSEKEIKEAVKEYLEKKEIDVRDNEIVFEKTDTLGWLGNGFGYCNQIICKVKGTEQKESE